MKDKVLSYLQFPELIHATVIAVDIEICSTNISQNDLLW